MGRSYDRDDVYGLDWDFLAFDRDGSIAILSSAGCGQVPQQVLDEGALVDAAVDALCDAPRFAESNDVRPRGLGGYDYIEWFELSQRGVYTYDYRDHLDIGPYQRISEPTVALSAADADPAIVKAASLLELPFRFAQTAQFWLGERSIPAPRFRIA